MNKEVCLHETQEGYSGDLWKNLEIGRSSFPMVYMENRFWWHSSKALLAFIQDNLFASCLSLIPRFLLINM